jgi:hypothetical protein
MMMSFEHLHAIEMRLRRETERLQAATTVAERQFRAQVVASCEKEIADEREFLGLDETTMSDEELLAALAQ